MKDTYSLYEAKAKLSAIMRMVREGHSVTVTVHGEPVAEIRPVPPRATGMEARIAHLRATGELTQRNESVHFLRPIARRPGALARFLADRNE